MSKTDREDPSEMLGDPFAIVKPDWAKWQRAEKGRLWQAVALACGYDPRNFSFPSLEQISPVANRPKDFSELLMFAKNNLGVTLKAISIDRDAREESEVLFSVFWSWYRAAGYELPHEIAQSFRGPNREQPSADETPLGERERTTLLTLIAALCHETGIDIAKPTKAANLIESTTVKLGVRVPARTIEGHLKRIPDALEKRSK